MSPDDASIELLLQQVQQALMDQDLEACRRLAGPLERALHGAEDRRRLGNCLGCLALELGEQARAITVFRELVEQYPQDLELANNLGYALLRGGKFDRAIEVFRDILDQQPDDAEALNNLGLALGYAGCDDESIATFRAMISLYPDNSQAHNNLGCALRSAGRSGEAVQHFMRAIELDETDVEAMNNLACVYKSMDRPGQAMELLETACHIAPDNALTHYNLAICAYQAGELEKTLHHLEAYLASAGDHYNAEQVQDWIDVLRRETKG